MTNTCRVCAAQVGNKTFRVREMLYGTREEFEYFECHECLSLQIAEIPSDLARHYRDDYLGSSFRAAQRTDQPTQSFIRAFLQRQRSSYFLHGKNAIGWAISRLHPDYFPYDWEMLRAATVSLDSKILDVGCGPGQLLDAMRQQGFRRLSGQDLFQRWTLPGLNIIRTPLEDIQGMFDLIMLHHSFEHMPDPGSTLAALRTLCAPGGTILIRVPVAHCSAWRQYGSDWYQIDAPRHLVIPSLLGMRLLAERARLKVFRVDFDSDETQFCCSEEYRRNIPLKDPSSYFNTRSVGRFSESQLSEYKQRASELNASDDGDQARFYLRPA